MIHITLSISQSSDLVQLRESSKEGETGWWKLPSSSFPASLPIIPQVHFTHHYKRTEHHIPSSLKLILKTHCRSPPWSLPLSQVDCWYGRARTQRGEVDLRSHSWPPRLFSWTPPGELATVDLLVPSWSAAATGEVAAVALVMAVVVPRALMEPPLLVRSQRWCSSV